MKLTVHREVCVELWISVALETWQATTSFVWSNQIKSLLTICHTQSLFHWAFNTLITMFFLIQSWNIKSVSHYLLTLEIETQIPTFLKMQEFLFHTLIFSLSIVETISYKLVCENSWSIQSVMIYPELLSQSQLDWFQICF